MLRKKLLRFVLERVIKDYPDLSLSETYVTYMNELRSTKYFSHSETYSTYVNDLDIPVHFSACDSGYDRFSMAKQLKRTEKASSFFFLNYEKIKQKYMRGN